MAAFLPPGGSMDVVFTLDTTGSMSQALDEVKGRVSDMMQRLLADIPGIKMAAVAHGDYCDEHVFYLTQMQNLTSNLPDLVNFVAGVEGTGGGDTAECYELVLKLVRENMEWTAGSQRIVVMIGDAYPHPKNDPANRDAIDWEEQVQLLDKMGVKIYGVQVFEDEESSAFFSKMAERTGGQHLKLTQFGHLCDVIMAICYREKGAEFLQNFEAEVQEKTRKTSSPNPDLEGVFDVLRRGNSTSSTSGVITAASSAEPNPRDSKDGGSDVTLAEPSIAHLRRKDTEPLCHCDVTAEMTSSEAGASSSSPKRKQPAQLPSFVGSMSLDCVHPLFDYRRMTRAPGRRKVQPKKKATKQSKPKYQRLAREKIPENNFRFRHLTWSPWKLLAVPAHQDPPTGKWREILSGVGKVRVDSLNGPNTRKSGHYHKTVFLEMSVQTSPGQRRHVIWQRVVTTYLRPISFSRFLTSGRYMRAQVARVMRSGCRVFVRMAEIGAGPRGRERGEEMERELGRQYDYAWCPRVRDTTCRSVIVSTPHKGEDMQIAGPDKE